mmetsp:Transcript_7622/g.24121  ORF Transcript_7622/g.24121 Transcript_7622/m.24121 type:complete len:275 (-) Transcript_7622:362-1186(-)
MHHVAHVNEEETALRQARQPSVVKLQEITAKQRWQPIARAPDANRRDADGLQPVAERVDDALLRHRLGEVVRRDVWVVPVERERPVLADRLMLRERVERVDRTKVDEALDLVLEAHVNDVLRPRHVHLGQDWQVARAQRDERCKVENRVCASDRPLDVRHVGDVAVDESKVVGKLLKTEAVALVDEHAHSPPLPQQRAHEVVANEAGRARHEHDRPSLRARVSRLLRAVLLVKVAQRVGMLRELRLRGQRELHAHEAMQQQEAEAGLQEERHEL